MGPGRSGSVTYFWFQYCCWYRGECGQYSSRQGSQRLSSSTYRQDRPFVRLLGSLCPMPSRSSPPHFAAAAPYWRRMASVHPGLPDGYLQSATVFWDYFQFDDALAQIAAARKQFHDPTLYGYEAGAIYENKNDTAKAIPEYVAAAIAGSGPAHDRLVTLATR